MSQERESQRWYGCARLIVVALVCWIGTRPVLGAEGPTKAAAARLQPRPVGDVYATWAAAGGVARLELDAAALAEYGVSLPDGNREGLTLTIKPQGSTLRLQTLNEELFSLSGALQTQGAQLLYIEGRTVTVGDFFIPVGGSHLVIIDSLDVHQSLFEIPSGQADVRLDRDNQTIIISGPVVLTEAFASEVLENPAAAGAKVGTFHLETGAEMIDLDETVGGGSSARGGAGPDVIVGGLTGPQNWTPTTSPNGFKAYSVGTTSCNVGTTNLSWIPNPNSNHPVIGQTLYRLIQDPTTGISRIEQLGQTWLKHAFCALQQTLCGACNPAGQCCCTALGVGCSDPYTASRNGSFGLLGPKSEVNPSTGINLGTHANPVGNTSLRGRMQIPVTDLTSQPAGTLYFIGAQYVAADDSAAGNKNNNASYRRVTVASGSLNLAGTGSTFQRRAPILAWADNVPGVIVKTAEQTPTGSDGQYTVASNVVDLGGGTWNYEYAVYNMNSDRAGRAFAVPIPAGLTVTNLGFRDVDYHDGDGFPAGTGVNQDGTDWTASVAGGFVTWTLNDIGVNSNALRWGTTYNFRFDANSPPKTSVVNITFFKAGSPTDISTSAFVPDLVPTQCNPGDGDIDCNGVTDLADSALFVAVLLGTNIDPDQVARSDMDGSTAVDGNDIQLFVGAIIP